MESKKDARPIVIRFKDTKELVDFTLRMELKYFLMALLYSHRNRE